VAFRIRDANPQPLSITRRARRGGPSDIVQIQIHATRGPVPMDRQVQATENWFADGRETPDGNDHGTWGSSADFVIGPDHRAGGETVIVRFGDWLQTFSSWSAGLGEAGTIGAATVGVAIELAQPLQQHPFTEETIDGLVWLCEHINDQLEQAGVGRVPAQRIDSWDQNAANGVPRGYIGHEDLANGKKLTKTDPGSLFPWADLINRVGGAPTLGVTPTAPSAAAARTLADYYARSGVTLPTVDERARIYAALGLGYRGSPKQNAKLLKALKDRAVVPRRASEL